MTIASILKMKGSRVAHVEPKEPVSGIIAMLSEQSIGAVLVCHQGKAIGVVSERDIARGLHRIGARILECRAEEVMTSPVITIAPHESVNAAMEMMTEQRVRHLPVESDGRLVGIVSIGDLVKRRIEEAEKEALALKDYITAA